MHGNIQIRSLFWNVMAAQYHIHNCGPICSISSAIYIVFTKSRVWSHKPEFVGEHDEVIKWKLALCGGNHRCAVGMRTNLPDVRWRAAYLKSCSRRIQYLIEYVKLQLQIYKKTVEDVFTTLIIWRPHKEVSEGFNWKIMMTHCRRLQILNLMTWSCFEDGRFYPRPVLTFGYCRCLLVCVYVMSLSAR